ncbi:hypothetical protein AAFF_G00008240 [Aldrovandia affinis]|uniref:Uncharacterized protein n=1 Tax=Aldrovandia affinis TaxID=143900 RepID=A0AAD7T6A0_9TELE|nr:hypothetical protein AAFF_G00008240 [Aldrovandia affinis]
MTTTSSDGGLPAYRARIRNTAKFGRGRARAPPPATAAVPPPGGGGPPTTPDLATPAEWGDSVDPAEDGAEGWNTRPVWKRPLSGEHLEARGHKEAPSIPLVNNRYEVLAGSEEGADFCTGMDLELASPFPYLDSWAVDNLLGSIGMV